MTGFCTILRSNIDVGLFGKTLYMVWQFDIGDEYKRKIYALSWGLGLPRCRKHRLKISPAALLGSKAPQSPDVPRWLAREVLKEVEDQKMKSNDRYELCLRLSQAEKKQLETNADKCGLSKSVYLRRLIMGAPVKAKPSAEIRELRVEVHKIGSNINQIARSIYVGQGSSELAQRALFLLGKVYEMMYKIAKR